MPTLAVNGAELYHQVRGEGPPVLLIMGATGDAGHFDVLAGLLADEFTVVSYDRRGNGRSPRPAGWMQTSVEEQAGDAAGLLDALGLSPAAVFGTSSGAIFALWLAVEHPEAVSCAVLHETAVLALVDDPPAVRGAMGAAVSAGMEGGGPPAAVETFWRFVATDAGWESLDPALRERMRASGEVYFGLERGKFEASIPGDEALAAIPAPLRVLVSDASPAFFAQASGRLAQRLGVEVARTPGTHAPYHDRPRELAAALRPLLRDVHARPA
jgi:pimeloyl-ACP methyl ester carboxylesterase